MCSGAVAASILAYILPALLFFAGNADEIQVAWRNLKTASAADPSPPSILPASVPTVDDNSPTAGADECKSAESAPVVDGREPETEIAGGLGRDHPLRSLAQLEIGGSRADSCKNQRELLDVFISSQL